MNYTLLRSGKPRLFLSSISAQKLCHCARSCYRSFYFSSSISASGFFDSVSFAGLDLVPSPSLVFFPSSSTFPDCPVSDCLRCSLFASALLSASETKLWGTGNCQTCFLSSNLRKVVKECSSGNTRVRERREGLTNLEVTL